MKLIQSLLLAVALSTAGISSGYGAGHIQRLPENKVCKEKLLCQALVPFVVAFKFIGWLAPLNRSDANPLRCRGLSEDTKPFQGSFATDKCGLGPEPR